MKSKAGYQKSAAILSYGLKMRIPVASLLKFFSSDFESFFPLTTSGNRYPQLCVENLTRRLIAIATSSTGIEKVIICIKEKPFTDLSTL